MKIFIYVYTVAGWDRPNICHDPVLFFNKGTAKWGGVIWFSPYTIVRLGEMGPELALTVDHTCRPFRKREKMNT